MAVSAPLPIQDAPREYSHETMNSILRAIEQRIQNLEQTKSTGWTLSNVTTDKTLDADSTTTAEVADVLGTLIQELIDTGVLSASS